MQFFFVLSSLLVASSNADSGSSLNALKQVLNFNADHLCFNGAGQFLCRVQTAGQKIAVTFITKGLVKFDRTKCCGTYRKLIKDIGQESATNVLQDGWDAVNDCFSISPKGVYDKMKEAGSSEEKAKGVEQKLEKKASLSKDLGKKLAQSVFVEYALDIVEPFFPEFVKNITGKTDDICDVKVPCVDQIRQSMKNDVNLFWIGDEQPVILRNLASRMIIINPCQGSPTDNVLKQGTRTNICKLSQSEMWALIDEARKNQALKTAYQGSQGCVGGHTVIPSDKVKVPISKCLKTMIDDQRIQKARRNVDNDIDSHRKNGYYQSNKGNDDISFNIVYNNSIGSPLDLEFSEENKSMMKDLCSKVFDKMVGGEAASRGFYWEEKRNVLKPGETGEVRYLTCSIQINCLTK